MIKNGEMQDLSATSERKKKKYRIAQRLQIKYTRKLKSKILHNKKAFR